MIEEIIGFYTFGGMGKNTLLREVIKHEQVKTTTLDHKLSNDKVVSDLTPKLADKQIVTPPPSLSQNKENSKPGEVVKQPSNDVQVKNIDLNNHEVNKDRARQH